MCTRHMLSLALLACSAFAIRAPLGGTLNCDKNLLRPSNSTPDDVNFVRPADITFFGALGDSITSGFGSCDSPCHLALSYPHNSAVTGCTAGGMEKHVTLGNILKSLNKEVNGCSTAIYASGLNVAVPGRLSSDLPRQASELSNKILMATRVRPVDMATGWKLITAFIGTNDINVMCAQGTTTSKTDFKRYIYDAIAVLQRMPRTIIVLAPLWDVDFALGASQIMTGKGYFCTNSDLRNTAQQRTAEFGEAMAELAADPRLQGKDKVVMQIPVFNELNGPVKQATGKYNRDFYGLDNFHLSKYGQSIVAKQMWRLLMSPIPERRITQADMQDEGKQLKCPAKECPYIRTPANSVNCGRKVL